MVCLDCSMMLRHHLPTWHTYKGRSLTRTCILISRSDAHLVLRHRTFHRRGWTWLNNAKHVLAKATFIRSLHPKFFFNQCSLEKIGKERASSIHPSIHPFIHSYIHTYTHLCIHTYIPVTYPDGHMHAFTHAHQYTYTCTQVHTHTYTYTCMCYHLHLHVCQLYTCTQQPFGIYVGVIV